MPIRGASHFTIASDILHNSICYRPRAGSPDCCLRNGTGLIRGVLAEYNEVMTGRKRYLAVTLDGDGLGPAPLSSIISLTVRLVSGWAGEVETE